MTEPYIWIPMKILRVFILQPERPRLFIMNLSKTDLVCHSTAIYCFLIRFGPVSPVSLGSSDIWSLCFLVGVVVKLPAPCGGVVYVLL